MSLKDLEIIDPKTRKNFRIWLKKHHLQKESVWITIYKANTSRNFLRTNDVVEECLCFGWVDSRPRKNDADTFFLLISPRRSKSVWSAINKKKVSSLIRRKLMTIHGLRKVKDAKKNGSWNALNKSDQLILPDELRSEFGKINGSYEAFHGLSKSTRRAILEWIYSAKSASTISNRIRKTAIMSYPFEPKHLKSPKTKKF